MELDTGAGLSIISEETFRRRLADQFHKRPVLQPAGLLGLRTYTGERVPLAGVTSAKVQYQNQESKVPLIVTRGKGPNLIGRNMLSLIKFDWPAVSQNMSDSTMAEFSSVFEDRVESITELQQELC